MTRLWLHGFTGGPATFDGLAQEGDLRPWLAGHGRRPVFVDRFEGEVERIAEQLSAEAPVDLIGYSMGARVALGIAVAFPKRVRRLFLVGVNPGIEMGMAREARQAWESGWAERIRREGVDAFVDAWSRIPLFATQTAVAPERLAAQDRLRRGHSAEGLAHAMTTCGLGKMPDYRAMVPALPMPVTFVVGAEDEKFRGIADALDLPPLGERVYIPHAGHNVVLEAPDALRRLVQTAG